MKNNTREVRIALIALYARVYMDLGVPKKRALLEAATEVDSYTPRFRTGLPTNNVVKLRDYIITKELRS